MKPMPSEHKPFQSCPYICFGGARRRRWHPTPVLLPGKSHGRRSLVDCSPFSHEELDMTEQLHFHFSLSCIGEGNSLPPRLLNTMSWIGDRRRQWHPTPVLSSGKSHGRRSLVGYRLWGCRGVGHNLATEQQ